jgi:glycosyltransferase involved in cell wall biosynthesis
MMHSLVPGVRYYRMVLPGDEMSKQFKHNIYCEDTSLDGLDQSMWQSRALTPEFGEMMEKLLVGIDVISAQLVHTDEGICALQGIREFFNIPIVLDVDDNVEDVPHYNQGAQAYRPNSGLSLITTDLVKTADAVTVTTEHLKKILSKYNDNIYVLPNSLDFDLWEKKIEMPKRSKKQIRIGWMGAQTHEDDFRMVLPAIMDILNKHKNVHFYVVGGVPQCVHALDHKRIHCMSQWYDILHYPSRMRMWQFDIGIAPLRDNAFNRSKSNLRWLEYSAMSVPSVVSRVEPFNRSVVDGKTGLFAYETDEWFEQLNRLVEDAALRQKIGAAANAEVKRHFDIRKNAKMWDKAYKKVLKKYKAEVKI